MLKSSKSASPDFIVLLGSIDNTYCPSTYCALFEPHPFCKALVRSRPRAARHFCDTKVAETKGPYTALSLSRRQGLPTMANAVLFAAVLLVATAGIYATVGGHGKKTIQPPPKKPGPPSEFILAY